MAGRAFAGRCAKAGFEAAYPWQLFSGIEDSFLVNHAAFVV